MEFKQKLMEKLKDNTPIFDEIMSLHTALTLVNSLFIQTIKKLDFVESPGQKKILFKDLEIYRTEIKMLYSGQNREKLLEKIANVYWGQSTKRKKNRVNDKIY